jgi:hypothetical protein
VQHFPLTEAGTSSGGGSDNLVQIITTERPFPTSASGRGVAAMSVSGIMYVLVRMLGIPFLGEFVVIL